MNKKDNSLNTIKSNKPRLDIRRLQTIILGSCVIVILIILGIFVENFATINNIFNLLVQVAPIGIMACGVTYVMITGGIDVSTPAVMATAAVIGADYMAKTGDLVFGPVLMLIVGAALGALNGSAVSFLRMVPLVVTLATMTISMGIAVTWTMGESVVGLSTTFSKVFNRTTVIVMFILITAIFSLILRQTKYGRWLYHIGNNVYAARVSGIPTRMAIFLAYVISGICAGIAGIINTAALSSARPGMGPESQIIDVITAVVLGGTSVSGGSGTIVGTAVGAMFIIMINNLMNLIGVPDYYTGFIKGLIIILAMGIDAVRVRFNKV